VERPRFFLGFIDGVEGEDLPSDGIERKWVSGEPEGELEGEPERDTARVGELAVFRIRSSAFRKEKTLSIFLSIAARIVFPKVTRSGFFTESLHGQSGLS